MLSKRVANTVVLSLKRKLFKKINTPPPTTKRVGVGGGRGGDKASSVVSGCDWDGSGCDRDGIGCNRM